MGRKKEELRKLLEQVRDVAAKAEADGRDLTADERKLIEESMAKASTLRNDVNLESALAGLEGEIAALDGDPDGSKSRQRLAGAAPAPAGKSIGQAFADSVSEFIKGLSPSGQIPSQAKVQTVPVGFGGLKSFGYGPGTGRPAGAKDLITGASDTSAGALVETDVLGLVDSGAYARPLSVLDVISRGSTGSDTVEYVRENVSGIVNAAAPVPEATTAGAIPDPDEDNTAGVKPESTYVLEKVTEAVRTIAHWIPATKRALSDAAQVRTLVDAFLRYGLLEELEDQIINGDGTGENFTGLLNVSGVQSQAWDTDLLTTTRKAKTKVKVVGRATANAYALHPNDAERLDLLKDDQGRFYYGGPSQDGAQPLWRLPVVEMEALPEGTGVVGDWRRALLWDREQAAISATDSHADFFIRNLVAILAELRAAFGVSRPAAFVTFPTTESASS